MTIELNLTTIRESCGLAVNLAEAYHDTTTVLLDRFHGGRGAPTAASIEDAGGSISPASIGWSVPTEVERDSHANTIDAAEFAAYALAIVVAFRHLGFRVVRRAPEGSGADFLMQPVGANDSGFVRLKVTDDRFRRLEVSGISGQDSAPSRLREKLAQLTEGDDPRPGSAVVVRFPDHPVRILVGGVS